MKNIRSLTWYDFGKWLVAALLLCGAAAVRGQDALEIIGGDSRTIKVEKQVITYVDATLVSKLPFTIKAPAGGFEYEWSLPKSVTGTTKRNVLEVNAAVKGEATVSVTWLVLSVEGGVIKQTERSATRTFYVGEVKPVPDPTPDPKPDPIPVGALRVIFVRESASNLTKEQLNTWNSTQIAAYLNAKCIKDGTQPGWRKFDKDQSADKDSAGIKQLWNDAKSDAIAASPSMIVAVGAHATVYPLTTEAEVLALLKKHSEGVK